MASKGLCEGGTQVLTLVIALWLLIIPLVDIADVIWPRSLSSKWSVGVDREHLHYRLVDCGDAAEEVVKGVFLLCLMLSGPGAFFYYIGVIESWSYVAFVLVCVGCFVVTHRRSQKT
jgi:hypothetical protein